MINVKTGQLTLGGQFDAYKRGQLERNIQTNIINEKNHSLCCGGSLGIMNIDRLQRDAETGETLQHLLIGEPELIATACPLCKKTLSKHSPVEVRDISEIVCDAIPQNLLLNRKDAEKQGIQ